MMIIGRGALALFLSLLPCTAFALDNAKVDRIDAASVKVSWTGKDPVSIYVADGPETPLSKAKLVTRDRKAGSFTLPLDTRHHLYLLLRDKGDGKVTRLAERLLPLEQGSNFRDIGGYAGAGGKTVKWGRIFRSGAMPMLSEKDYALLSQLRIGSIIDLRSNDEREIAPTQLDDRTGALFLSNDYAFASLFAANSMQANGKFSTDLYASYTKTFLPQYRQIFNRLLADDGAVLYNCSAGQDRTGTATALILSALGVPRDVILADYHLSTQFRRPDYEFPKLDPAAYPGNAFVKMMAAYSGRPGANKAQPLYGPDGIAYLQRFLEGIDAQWGSVDRFLEVEIGLTPQKRDRLRALALE
jgi:protein-tyrosine phosphatase